MRRFAFLLALSLGLAAQEPIRIGGSEWSTLNPLLITQDTDSEALDLLFDRLITIDAKGEFVPELLESWTILKGGREVLLKLRPGMTWHDGRPIHAEDVVFTWRMLRLPEVRKVADTTPGIPSLDSLEAEGPLQVRIHLKRPRGTLLSDLYGFIPVPRHLYQMGANPAKAPINFQPVGSGPYRIVGIGTAKLVKLERWDGYRGAHPGTWPAFELKDIAEEKRLVPAFEAGRLHYAGAGRLGYYLARKGVEGKGLVEAVAVPLASFGAFFLNCDPRRSILGDVEVRRALAELIPWESMARGMRFFPTQLASNFWPPQSWAYDPTPRPLPQLSRAAEILERAGWKLGADGLRHDAAGRPLQIVAYDSDQGQLSQVAQLIHQAAKVGFKVERKEVPFAEIISKASNHEGDLWSYGWVLSLDPDVDSPLFTREGLLTKANVSAYLNPEIDRLFDEGRHTLDPKAREKIYRRISTIIYRDKPVIPLAYVQNRVLHSQRLKGVSFHLLGQSFGFWPGRRGWSLLPPPAPSKP